MHRPLVEGERHRELIGGERVGAARCGRELSVHLEGEDGAVRQVVQVDGDLIPVDDPVGLDLDGDSAGRAGEDTEGEQDEEKTLHTITYRCPSI